MIEIPSVPDVDPTRQDATPDRGFDLRPFLFALGVGALGGALATYLDVPLGWMLGSMTFTTVTALAGARQRIPDRLRVVTIGVLGVMVGSTFTPAIIDYLGAWAVTFALLFVFVVIGGAVSYVFFRRVAKYDHITAYFSGAPGGLTEMVVIGGTMGGDERVIALSQSMRILVVVLTLPVGMRVMAGVSRPTLSQFSGPLLSVEDLAILLAASIVGYFAARAARFPAYALTGPMTASAIVHMAGITAAHPPAALVAIAQVIMGSVLGCRFAGASFAMLRRVFGYAAISTFLLMVVTLLVTLIGIHVSDASFPALLLALAPGGVAEMSLTALALHVDVAFVSTHHIVRIAMVVLLAPTLFRRIWQRYTQAP